MGIRVLVIGRGGREHAIVWKLAQSAHVDAIVAAPGNPGMDSLATRVPVQPSDFDGLVQLATDQAIDLAVIGPEDPLAAGLADRLEQAGIRVAGPSAAAAQLEASKSFAKDVMAAANIPTARSRTVTTRDDGLEAISELGGDGPVVVKADGLAEGKGVVVARSTVEAVAALDAMIIGGAHGDAGRTVVIEEFLEGPEVSILCLSDGATLYPLQPSCDYKRAFDNDEGPNTGGMGNYTPTRLVDEPMLERIRTTILQPAIDEMAKRGTPMKGILFAGLIVTTDGPKVLEFNCRFGDPETEVVLPTLDGDLGALLDAVASGTLHEHPRPAASGAAVGVILASRGYPGQSDTGHPITGIDTAEEWGAIVFHAGTKRDDNGTLVNGGGRVLCVTAVADDLATARDRAYAAADAIAFDGAWHRTDIASREL